MEKLERLEAFVKKHIDMMLFVLGGVATLLVLGVSFYALDKNLFFWDEGWYVTLMRDGAASGPYRFALLFHGAFAESIYANRLFCWIFKLIGSVVFAIGLGEFIYPYMNRKPRKWIVWTASLLSVYLSRMGVGATPFYAYPCMQISIEIGAGLLLLGISKGKSVWYFLSGFFISYLLPLKITSAVIIPLMLLVILLMSPKKMRDSLFFCGGVVLFLIYYFVCVETPGEVYSFLLTETEKTMNLGREEYGIFFLIKWLKDTAMFLFKYFVVAVIIYSANHSVNKYFRGLNKYARISVTLILSALILLYVWRYLPPVTSFKIWGKYAWFSTLFWILIFLFFVDDIVNGSVSANKLIVGCFLCLLPVFYCFGSNNPFWAFCPWGYISPVLVLFQGCKNFSRKFLVFVLLAICFASFVLYCTHKSPHGDVPLFSDKVSVRTIGIDQSLKLDAHYLPMLDSCRKYVPAGAVLCSKCEWGNVALLGYKPISYEFDLTRRSSTEFQKLIDDSVVKYGSFWVISDTYNYHSLRLNEMVENIKGYSISKIVAGDNCYYCVQNLRRENSIYNFDSLK